MVVGSILETLAVGILWLGSSRRLLPRLVLLPPALYVIQCDAEDVSVRGQLFGDLAFVLLLGLLARLRDGKRVHPAWIVAGSALWVNLHPSFLLMALLPLASSLLLLLDSAENRPRLRPFAAASGWALAGMMVNPYGPAYVRHALGTAMATSTQSYDLFRSPPFHDVGWLIPPMIGLLLMIARGRWGPSRARRAEQTFVACWVVAACLARRYAPQLIAVEIGVFAPMLDSMDSRLARRAGRLSEKRLAAAGLSTFALLTAAIAASWLRERKDPLRDVPAAAAEVAHDAEQVRAHAGAWPNRIVNPLHWGGYLAYAWMGHPKYFIDGRDHVVLFGNGTNSDAQSLWAGAPDSDELLDTYEAGIVLWERGAPLDLRLRTEPGWQLVHQDRIAVVYLREPHRAGD